MKIVAAKCTNCGGVLEVDAEKDAAVCKYCNTPFIVEKAIENYNITNNYTTINNTVNNTVNNISGQEVHIHQDGESPEQLLENIKALLKRNERDLANKTYQKLKEKYPADYRVDEANICLIIDTANIYDLDEQIWIPLKNLKESNRSVYEVCYGKLLNHINQKLLEKTNKTFRGGLLNTKIHALKWFGGSIIQDCLKSQMGFVVWWDKPGWDLSVWSGDRRAFGGVAEAIGKDSKEEKDDEFLIFMLTELNKVLVFSRSWKPVADSYQFYTDWYNLYPSTKPDYRSVLKPREDALKNVCNAFEKRLSPEAKERFRRENRKREIEKFWNAYGKCMQSKLIKEAYNLLLSNSSIAGASKELAKFKKGIFGVKYLGDVNALNAGDLINATLAAEGLK